MTDRCIQGLDAVPDSLRGCTLSIGNFDGVHLGHQKIIQTARELAARENAPVVAMTFEPPPEAILRPGKELIRILPVGHKCCALLGAGADYLVTAAPSADLLGLAPEAFVERYVQRAFGARHVVEGTDFRFGAHRAGDVHLLAQLAPRHGFEMHVVEPVTIDIHGQRERISSSLIRKLIRDGRVAEARRCMGRAFVLHGPVIAGEGRGRLMDFPTANMEARGQVLPAEGVYAAWAVISPAGTAFADASIAGSVRAPAAVSIGHKPTTGPTTELVIEAFLLDADGDFYGRPMSLALLERVRGQEKFADIDSLRAQIARDVERVRGVCEGK